jgi:hypothetical protein
MAARKNTAQDAPADVSEALVPVEQLTSMSKLDRFTDSTLRNVSSFEDAMALASEVYGDVKDITQELGNGFTLLSREDKNRLVKKPFVVLHFGLTEGDFGTFASVAVVTKDNKKFIFNDGSTGVRDQLVDLAQTHKRFGGFMVPNGLAESEYDTCKGPDGNSCGRARSKAVDVCQHCGDTSEKRGSATTYYFDLTPENA